MDIGDGFSIDTDLMSLLNSQEITSTAGLQEALTQIEGRYHTQLDAQVVDIIKEAYASHRRITGLWLHFKDWTEGLDQSTSIAADKIHIAFAELPDTISTISDQNKSSQLPSNIPVNTAHTSDDPIAGIGEIMGQFLSGFTQSLQQIPQIAAQIPQALPGLGQSLEQAFQPMQELIQEITQALGNDRQIGSTNTANESNPHYADSESDFRSDHRQDNQHDVSHRPVSSHLDEADAKNITDSEIDHPHGISTQIADPDSPVIHSGVDATTTMDDQTVPAAAESHTQNAAAIESESPAEQNLDNSFKDDPMIRDNITID